MLGFASSYSEPASVDFVHISNKTYSLYAVDDWRVSNRLTLNLGLRWEGHSPRLRFRRHVLEFLSEPLRSEASGDLPAERRLDTNGPGFTTVSGIILSDVKFYLNGVGMAGRNGIPPGLVDNHWNTFAPRLGFAYDLTGRQKTILRGGAGIFYERLAGNEKYNMGQNNVPFAYQSAPTKCTSTVPRRAIPADKRRLRRTFPLT